ncbi:Cyclin-D2-1 [Sesamum alatum]|uniref:Cyclin-D2-1 n=1 Tax=Sesamum alatum TaxID=300844 RepID=A0AAE2CQ96_9LAMI|nr:Cyclin-D2-1 [Sesamum alatum]
MAENNSFDCAEAADLLCDEETKGLCFDDGDLLLQPFNDQTHQTNGEKGMSLDNGRSDSEPLILLPCLSDECIGWMVERERVHLPAPDYLNRLRSGVLDMSLRREALDWMLKACAHHNFGELCLYLAMNYLDRFLSVYSLPGGKSWAVQLVAVACLSLAAKIDEVDVPSTVDLQAGEPKFLFEGKTIQRMEMLVLNYLKWNMKSYTPFDFIEYFIRKTNHVRLPPGPLIARSIQIILSTIKGIDFLEFRPSEIAAAVAVYVSGEIRAMDIDKALSGFMEVEKGRVVKCLELIQDLISMSGGTTSSTTTTTATTATANTANAHVSSSVPVSPIGVLEAACLSYKSDETTTSSHNKRRKLEPKTAFDGGS